MYVCVDALFMTPWQLLHESVSVYSLVGQGTIKPSFSFNPAKILSFIIETKVHFPPVSEMYEYEENNVGTL